MRGDHLGRAVVVFETHLGAVEDRVDDLGDLEEYHKSLECIRLLSAHQWPAIHRRLDQRAALARIANPYFILVSGLAADPTALAQGGQFLQHGAIR